jgi:hypothetical protein
MTILYSNGCSFTAQMNLPREDRYPLLIGKHCGWTVYDKASPGSCNTKIIRRAMRDCSKLLQQQEKIIALIQLTYKERWEYAGDPEGSNSWQYGWCEDLFETIKPNDEKNWPLELQTIGRQIFLLQKENALYSQLFSNLLGLVSFFKVNKIDYKIFAGPQGINDDHATMTQDAFYQYLSQDKNILDLTNFNILSLTGSQIHPDSAGMQKIADYFINLFDAQE